MNAGPLVSIVLPAYNGSRYLGAAIESCLQQTFPDWELILVDDASTDDTPALMSRYAARDNRIRVFRNAANSKLPKSLNHGFAQARGELFTWTSDDNCYRPEALATMVNLLKNNAQVDVVYTNYTVMDEDGAAKKAGPTGAGPLEELPFRNVVGACFLYRRAVHEQLGGYAEDLFLVEDWDFWLRASTRFRVVFLDQDLYLYRWHSRSLSLQRSEEIRQARERALARNLGRMRWLPKPVWSRAWRDLIDQAGARGDRSAARSRFRESLRGSPLMPIRLGLGRTALLFAPARIHCWAERLEARQRRRRLQRTLQKLHQVIPENSVFILVDEEQLRGEITFARALPFPEKEGQWWGAPENDEFAISEFERLRRAGAAFIVFAWPAFWWLDYYKGLRQHLESQCRCSLKDEHLTVFDLRKWRAL
jgi:GT2 family glycosyltransferase